MVCMEYEARTTLNLRRMLSTKMHVKLDSSWWLGACIENTLKYFIRL